MKKILSTLLIAAMLLSLVIVAAMPTAAADELDGDWAVWGSEIDYTPNLPDESKVDVPGYGYTDRGFSTTGAHWKMQSPFTHIQTKDAVNLKDGVYFEVEVDEFDYDAGDAWFNVNIWSDAKFAPPSPVKEYGHGIQTLIRGSKFDDGTKWSIQWDKEEWTYVGANNFEINNYKVTNGETTNVKFVVEITYNANDGYHMIINGASLEPAAGETINKVDAYLNEAFGENSEVYVGFAMRHTTAGGKQAATVTKFGTSATDATKPTGSGEVEAKNYSDALEMAEPMDESTVPAGAPAVLMTGNMTTSDLWSIPDTATGSAITITDDFNVSVMGKGGTVDAGTWKVKLDKNYDLKDFPVYMMITKNLCVCEGDTKADCEAWEIADIYPMIGNTVGAESKNKLSGLQVYHEGVFVIGDDTYLYFIMDLVGEYGTKTAGKDAEGNTVTYADGGRINGIRVDVLEVSQDMPDFEVCQMGFFRSEEDAAAHAEAFIAALDGTTPPAGDEGEGEQGGNDDTQAPAGDVTVETDAKVEETDAKVEETDAKVEETDAKVEETDAKVEETDAKVEETDAKVEETDAKVETDAKEETTKEEVTTKKEEATTAAPVTEEPKSGCGSVVGFGAVAVVVAMAAGVVCFKKKED